MPPLMVVHYIRAFQAKPQKNQKWNISADFNVACEGTPQSNPQCTTPNGVASAVRVPACMIESKRPLKSDHEDSGTNAKCKENKVKIFPSFHTSFEGSSLPHLSEPKSSKNKFKKATKLLFSPRVSIYGNACAQLHKTCTCRTWTHSRGVFRRR